MAFTVIVPLDGWGVIVKVVEKEPKASVRAVAMVVVLPKSMTIPSVGEKPPPVTITLIPIVPALGETSTIGAALTLQARRIIKNISSQITSRFLFFKTTSKECETYTFDGNSS